jgi:tRNA A-37 threonylcarbamoyl transferase component Bud32
MTSALSCLSEDELLSWHTGGLGAEKLCEVERHLDSCESCREVLRRVAGEQPTERETRPLGPIAPERIDDSRARVLGRYQLLEVMGEGSMGVVYSAYDPELDRKVALKLLHAKPLVPSDPVQYDQMRERLRREAQTMAQLSHPNIVTVFDVGMADGQLFITMELIAGGTLATESESRPSRPFRPARSIARTLELFIAAGRGLEAAHAAGFVHRDFKAANVLVGASGRVCVTDFGLARIADGAATHEPASSTAPHELGRSLTETSFLVGTPRYMAPEQLRGDAVDARADQFSFCVTLYHALYGELPFLGESLDELCNAVEAGAVREPPRGSKVPQWLRQVLLRGLRARANDRYPSMAALLHDLERGRTRKSRRVLGAGIVVLLIAAIAGGILANRPAHRLPPLRAADAERLAQIHDAPTKARIHAAFASSGKPYAEDSWRAITRALDRFAANWQRSYTETWEATHVRGEQSPEVLDLRMDCLRHRLDDAAELIALFERADGSMVEHSVQATQTLGGLDRCSDVRALRQEQGPPVEPQRRAAYDALERKLAHVKALGEAARYVEGKEQIGAILQAAERLDHPLLLSDALFWQGIFQRFSGELDAAERSLLGAAAAAERGADDGRAAAAWDQLAFLTAEDTPKIDAAARWLEHGAAAGERAGPDAARAALHERAAAQIAVGQHGLGTQGTALKKAIELYHRAGDVVGEAEAASSSGFLLALAGHLGDGEADCERSGGLISRNLGREHPSMAPALFCFGFTALLRLQLAHATEILRKTIALQETAYGRDTPWAIATYQVLIETEIDRGHLDEAESAIAHVEDVERHVSMHPSLLAMTTLLKGKLFFRRDRLGEALPLLEKGYRFLSENHGSDSQLASAGFNLAQILWNGGGDRARAVQLAKDAQAQMRTLGPAPAYLLMRLNIWAWLRKHAPK